MKSAKYIHAALVKRGIMVRDKPGKMFSRITLLEAFAGHLRAQGISFAQWCTEWGMEIEEAVEGIEKLTVPAQKRLRGISQVITLKPLEFHLAICFPANQVPPCVEQNRITVDLDWDADNAAYMAVIRGTSIVDYGDSYRSAFHLAVLQRKCLDEIARIDALPQLPGAGIDW